MIDFDVVALSRLQFALTASSAPGESVRTVTTALAALALSLLGAAGGFARAQGIQMITAEGQHVILTDPGTDREGAADADVHIVEYFDYNCPYCKKEAPVLQALLAADSHLALINKEWPILSDTSVYAAQSALAARWQGKYLLAHHALMQAERLKSNAEVDAALAHAGLNMKTLAQDRERHAQEIQALLDRSDTEAHALHLRGTPGLVIERMLLPGIVELPGMQQLVAEARQQAHGAQPH